VDYTYLIVGAGMTADAAIEGIRQADPSAAVALIGSESHPPYNRPPLSKDLWKGKPPDSVWRRTNRDRVDLALDRTVTALDLTQKQVADDRGARYGWQKLLLATGGTPRRLGRGADDRIIYFRTLDDYTRLRALTEHGRRFAVIGAGFIGSEIAAALAMNGKEVVLLFPGEAIGGHQYPRDLALFLNDYYREKGVNVRPGERIAAVRPAERGERTAVRTEGGFEAAVDGVVAGIGIEPNVALARDAGLELCPGGGRGPGGVVVDELLRTRHPDVYAAGDVAAFYNPALGRRLRVEHEDNANTMGKAAGRNMAGGRNPYHHLPFFYSDLFDLGYEAVGDLDSRLQTVADWRQPFREGVVYYMQDGRVRGVLLWNTWGQVDAARGLIAEPGPFRPADLKGRLPAAK
jgi:3-phenylpropionate/trans-cinnamate dioxygenase ferredoxin reductase subunit